jgi:hypothetical protein
LKSQVLFNGVQKNEIKSISEPGRVAKRTAPGMRDPGRVRVSVGLELITYLFVSKPSGLFLGKTGQLNSFRDRVRCISFGAKIGSFSFCHHSTTPDPSEVHSFACKSN